MEKIWLNILSGYFLSPEDVLIKVVRSKKGRRQLDKQVLVVPKVLREHILYQGHAAKTAGHLGVEKTLARLKLDYFWKTMAQDVKKYCDACPSCN